ncbi:MAG: acyl-CoA dehydrogenase family protein [Candidatus Hydrogenedentota bacterium]
MNFVLQRWYIVILALSRNFNDTGTDDYLRGTGMGLAKEMPLERWYRELRTRRIGEGPSEVHRMVISRELFG